MLRRTLLVQHTDWGYTAMEFFISDCRKLEIVQLSSFPRLTLSIYLLVE